MADFREFLSGNSGDWGDSCELIVEHRGSFVSVVTDQYEGYAMMSIAAAEALLAALPRAIEVAKEQSKARMEELRDEPRA